MQVFAVAVSDTPLPAYQEWSRTRQPIPWRKQSVGEGVWGADVEGTYPIKSGAVDRGGVKKLRGVPPLAGLCRALTGGNKSTVVEALAFPVRAKGDDR
jgi:hypothetical protein